MTAALLLFVSTFVSVFALGLQSLNVNQGHYWAAAATSVAISTGHIFLYKYMPDSGLLQWGGFYAGGVLGIVSSMWFHRRVKVWWARARHRRAASRIARGAEDTQ